MDEIQQELREKPARRLAERITVDLSRPNAFDANGRFRRSYSIDSVHMSDIEMFLPTVMEMEEAFDVSVRRVTRWSDLLRCWCCRPDSHVEVVICPTAL